LALAPHLLLRLSEDAAWSVAKEEPGMQKLGMSIFAAAMMFAVACDDGAIDKSGQAARCGNICKAVDDCTGEDNSTDCRMECVDRSTNDDFEAQAEECFECVDRDNSCSSNVINCASECAGVVALSST
jgi:hypothetical protein